MAVKMMHTVLLLHDSYYWVLLLVHQVTVLLYYLLIVLKDYSITILLYYLCTGILIYHNTHIGPASGHSSVSLVKNSCGAELCQAQSSSS